MDTKRNVGLIECSGSTLPYLQDISGELSGFNFRKVLVKNNNTAAIQEEYSLAEIVNNTGSIIHDESIELVILANPNEEDLLLIPQAIGAGKQVRIL